MSTPFFTFFRYFFLPLKKRKRQPFFLGIKAAFFIIIPFLVTLICLVCFIGFICLFVFAGINAVFLCKFCSVHTLLVVLFRFVCFVIVFVHDYDLLSSFFFSQRASLAVIVCLVFLILFAFLLLGFFSVSSLLYNKKEGCPSPCRNLIFNCLLFRCTAPYGTP